MNITKYFYKVNSALPAPKIIVDILDIRDYNKGELYR